MLDGFCKVRSGGIGEQGQPESRLRVAALQDEGWKDVGHQGNVVRKRKDSGNLVF